MFIASSGMRNIILPRKLLTLKESDVYSILDFKSPYDSFGVEHEYVRINFYKHAIHTGLSFKKSFLHILY